MFGKLLILFALTVVNADDSKILPVVKKCDAIVTESLQLIQLHSNINTIFNQTINCVANRYALTDPACYLQATKVKTSNQIKFKCRTSSSRKKIYEQVLTLKEELLSLNAQLDGYTQAEGEFVIDSKVVNDLRRACRIISSSKMEIFNGIIKMLEEAQKCAKYEIKELCLKEKKIE